jgi:LacI family transcriptional regulator
MVTVEAFFFERGYSVLMSNTSSDPQKELEYLSMMESEAAAGLIVVPTSENVNRIAELAEKGLPIVVIDRRMADLSLDCVLSDNVEGARVAVGHLIGLGHSRIGHIGGPLHLSSGRERLQGYRQAMAESGTALNEGWIRFGNHMFDSGYQNTTTLLAEHPELTALFIENNMMSLGALTALHDLRLRIPEDVAVVGFDDVPWATILNPPLTVVAQATADIGNQASALLLERIEQPSLPSRTHIVPTSLIVRGSCGGVPSSPKSVAKRGGEDTI